MTEPTINPDYQLYVTRFNVMFHDYNMPEADIAFMLGPEPQKYVWPVAANLGNNGELAPDPWAFRRYVDDNYIDDDEPYISGHPGNGWGL